MWPEAIFHARLDAGCTLCCQPRSIGEYKRGCSSEVQNAEKDRLFEFYLRFLNSFVPSISVMYSKPASMSWAASLRSLAVLHVHSSSWFRKVAFSRLM